MMFTDEQLCRARETDLETWLRARGETLRRAGTEYRWITRDGAGEHDSVTVRGSRWYDFRNSVGGDAIGFIQRYMNFDFKEAVSYLLDGQQGQLAPPDVDAKKPRAPVPFVPPEKSPNMRRLYAYLVKTRGVAPDVITHFVRAGTLYEETEHHNIVFLATDENGVPRAAALKGTISEGAGFKQTAAGSDTRYGFCHRGTSDRLYVFEAPVDMLSFLCLKPENWREHSYLALDGLSPKALLHTLAQNAAIADICLCLDNDGAGCAAAEKFTAALTARGYAVRRLLPVRKDWNEDLQAARPPVLTM
ncbi:MAG: DUF3991 domain-containing protein [Oscillospiraceae bacterium]|jgi:hypothetical protein|nr:DUF3991 domain-containing protein [Oscillospiraceae bacterium]